MLYHVGCGRPLFKLSQAAGMALACACGALSPIVVADLEDDGTEALALPSSLLGIRKEMKDKPHLEYYLGFSDFDCPAKRAWQARLREDWGLVSFSECPQKRCREEPERVARRMAMREGAGL